MKKQKLKTYEQITEKAHLIHYDLKNNRYGVLY